MPYIQHAEIEKAKRIDLLSYLKQHEPDELVRLGNNSYCTKTHDSLKLSNDKWYWWSQGFGGRTALDYLLKVKGMGFYDAVFLLGATEYGPPLNPGPINPSCPQTKKLHLPPADKDNDEAIQYLLLRGIDPHIISCCIKDGLIYQARQAKQARQARPKGVRYVTFVGKDIKGIARYAAIQSTTKDFKGEAEGSDKRFSFKLESPTETSSLHVFEGVIDALSFVTLAQMEDVDWRTYNALSLGGVPSAKGEQGTTRIPASLAQYLSDHPKTTMINLHLDNDDPGIYAARMIASALTPQGYSVSISPPPAGKDVNEYLMLTHTQAIAPAQAALLKPRISPIEKTTEPKRKEKVSSHER